MPAKRPAVQAESAESQDRTGDTAIFSRVLYQLSYLGLKVRYFPKAPLFYTYVRGLSSAFQIRGVFHNFAKGGKIPIRLGDNTLVKEESMSEGKPTPASGKELDEVRKELREWKRQHPRATLAEIERETMKRMAQVQAQIIEELSQSLSPEERRIAEETPRCPECQTKMQRRGQAERQQQAGGGQTIRIERSYWVCPACGAGIFPPG
jgi:YgiT-type zinc finger domain-containing protein